MSYNNLCRIITLIQKQFNNIIFLRMSINAYKISLAVFGHGCKIHLQCTREFFGAALIPRGNMADHHNSGCSEIYI